MPSKRSRRRRAQRIITDTPHDPPTNKETQEEGPSTLVGVCFVCLQGQWVVLAADVCLPPPPEAPLEHPAPSVEVQTSVHVPAAFLEPRRAAGFLDRKIQSLQQEAWNNHPLQLRSRLSRIEEEKRKVEAEEAVRGVLESVLAQVTGAAPPAAARDPQQGFLAARQQAAAEAWAGVTLESLHSRESRLERDRRLAAAARPTSGKDSVGGTPFPWRCKPVTPLSLQPSLRPSRGRPLLLPPGPGHRPCPTSRAGSQGSSVTRGRRKRRLSGVRGSPGHAPQHWQ